MSMNACLAPLCSMHGLAVTTIEGIGSTRTKLHAVQVNLILIGYFGVALAKWPCVTD